MIARALAKDPAERFQSAGDLGRAAAAAAAGGPVAGRDTVVATGAAAPIEIDTRTAGTAIAPPRRRRRPPRPNGSRRGCSPSRPWPSPSLAAVAVGALAMRGEGDDGKANAPEKPRSVPGEAGLKVTATLIGGRPNNVIGAGAVSGRVGSSAAACSRSTRRRGSALAARDRTIGVGLTGLVADGTTIWALAARDRQLVQLDARTGARLGDPVPLPSAGNALAVADDAVYVAVSQPQLDPGDQILEIDKQTGLTRRTIDVRDGVRRLELYRGRLWLLASSDAELVGIDLRDREPPPARGPRDRLLRRPDRGLRLPVGDARRRRPGGPRRPAHGHGGDVRDGPRARPAIVVRKGTAWIVNRASSTLTRLDIRSGRVRGEIRVPINPYEIAAYDDALWITCLADGRIARVTGLDG